MKHARPTTLGEIATKIVMGPFGSKIKTENFIQAGIPVIRGGNLTDSKFKEEGFVFVDDAKAEELKSAWAFPLDIVITHRGTLGQAAIIPATAKYKKYIVSQSQMKISIDPAKADPYFIYYFLNSPIGQQRLLANTSQVGVPAIAQPTSSVKAIEIDLPETVDDQLEITKVLRSLDDKIELNRRLSKTLEALTQALFQSWFVDFDPVRAKASGEAHESICQRLGLTPELLLLFPDRLVDSGLGEIPEGWEVQRLDQMLGLAYGKALKASDRVPGSVPVYGSGGITGYHNEHLVEGPSIIVGRKGTVGSLYWEDGPFYPIDTVFYVVPKVELTYCFYVLQRLGLNKMNTDAAVPGLNRNNAYRLLVATPSASLREAFDRQIKLLRNQITAKAEESILLTMLRNSLLPKLLAGDIFVPAEGAV